MILRGPPALGENLHWQGRLAYLPEMNEINPEQVVVQFLKAHGLPMRFHAAGIPADRPALPAPGAFYHFCGDTWGTNLTLLLFIIDGSAITI